MSSSAKGWCLTVPPAALPALPALPTLACPAYPASHAAIKVKAESPKPPGFGNPTLLTQFKCTQSTQPSQLTQSQNHNPMHALLAHALASDEVNNPPTTPLPYVLFVSWLLAWLAWCDSNTHMPPSPS